MLIKQAPDIRSSEITPERLYYNRRQFIQATSGAALGGRRRGRARPAGRRSAGRPAGGSGRPAAEPVQHRRAAELLRGDHQLQQLLRVRPRQGRSETARRRSDRRAVDGPRRGPHEPARGRLHARGHPEPAHARGAHLPAALRRGMVDGGALGRLPARRPDQALRADVAREVRAVRDALPPVGVPRPARPQPPVSVRWRGCGWTRR